MLLLSQPRSSYPWLFSAPVDLAVFLGSAVASLAALAVGVRLGLLGADETPGWAWVPAVLLVDVAHVYATGFRVYLDTDEWHRRPWLYSLVPVLGFAIGVALYALGPLVFWRTLAYLAVFHFVRQQYGWVALYRARAGEQSRLGKWIDSAAIYLATIYPLIYWHCHLPRAFNWFIRSDFATLPPIIERIAAPLYALALAAYTLRAGYLWLVLGQPNPGKDIVVVTTVVCWYFGIVGLNSDYAFTVTNVIIHGVPYLALVYWYRWQRQASEQSVDVPRSTHWPRIATFLSTLWLVAYVEELIWDRGVWHDRPWLFGSPWELSSYHVVLVPLLAAPQITHYVLDGFIWKRKSNPAFALIPEADVGGTVTSSAKPEA